MNERCEDQKRMNLDWRFLAAVATGCPWPVWVAVQNLPLRKGDNRPFLPTAAGRRGILP